MFRAFANAGGGVILLGVKTEASTDHFGDEIVSVNPMAQGLVNATPIQRHLGCVDLSSGCRS